MKRWTVKLWRFVLPPYRSDQSFTLNTTQEAQNGIWKRTGQLLRAVTMESATFAVPNEEFHNQIPLDSDHSNIVKYDHPSDDGFIIVLTKLKECVQKLQNESSSGM
jgi:hypothetical protein